MTFVVMVTTSARYPFIHYTVYKNGATSAQTGTSLTTATAAAATTTPTTTTTTTTQPAVNGATRTARESHKSSRVRNHVQKQIVEITKSYGMCVCVTCLPRPDYCTYRYSYGFVANLLRLYYRPC